MVQKKKKENRNQKENKTKKKRLKLNKKQTAASTSRAELVGDPWGVGLKAGVRRGAQMGSSSKKTFFFF